MRSIFHGASPSRRLSIVLPFVIISIALGVLAYRSYQLSVRMEKGLTALAAQYLGYAAEITASRADAATKQMIATAADDWREEERSVGTTDYTAVQQWTLRHPWIVSALFVPDEDPEAAVYVSETEGLPSPRKRITREFFTAEGSMRYSFDPHRLLEAIAPVVTRVPEIHAPHLPEAKELQQQSRIALIERGEVPNLTKDGQTMSVVFPLDEPLSTFAIRASVKTPYVGRGWSNQRIMSLWLAVIAFVLVTIGIAFAVRGLAQEADAMQLRAALIANVSHELRTPLSMIRLGAETLRRGSKLSPKDRGDLEDSILREVLHLSHLVENVLDVARLQRSAKPLVFAPVDPVDLVRSLVTTYESWIKSKGFTVDLQIDTNIGPQMWDRESVSRALLNLVDNAIKYSADDKHIIISLLDHGDNIELSVRDRGVGIRASEISKIFDPYYRAEFSDTESRRGAGLGLTLVQQIINSHGGKIDVDSVPGEGSTFRLLFPKPKERKRNEVRDLIEAEEG
jgi:signal transduction histidine kinase